MTKPLPDINLSHHERAAQCEIGEKVRVQVPELRGSVVLRDVATSNAGSDQYLNYSVVRGMNFEIPVCPCTGPSGISASITIRTPDDFRALTTLLGNAVLMEQSVCWQMRYSSGGNNGAVVNQSPAPAPSVDQAVAAGETPSTSRRIGGNLRAMTETFLGQLATNAVEFGITSYTGASLARASFNQSIAALMESSTEGAEALCAEEPDYCEELENESGSGEEARFEDEDDAFIDE